MSNIELTDKRPIYGGKDWSVAGLNNERIIATGIFFYDVANITQRGLQFRETFCPWDFEDRQFDIDSVIRVYGLSKDDVKGHDYLVSQELGDVEIKDGRCVVFPNILQHKMPELRLGDRTKPGHCKMLVFYFVDPSTRIPSTEIVPPQQQEWHFEDVLKAEPFRSLPNLVIDGIMDKMDYPISLKEAKSIRLQVHQDTNFDKADTADPLRRVRNIGIIAHIDAGKTTTTERMLHYAGFTRTIGDVDDGDTIMDYLPAERERGITIQSAAITFGWRDHQLHLIDTPGHVDFTVEVERAMRVLDGAVTIVDAVSGVQAQTKTVWTQAARYQIPRIIFVNKMDRDGANWRRSIRDIEAKLSACPLVLMIPEHSDDTGGRLE
ncbi:Ribosome-releasing factor 2, mitochondrial, partial [Coemansia aciculifera]